MTSLNRPKTGRSRSRLLFFYKRVIGLENCDPVFLKFAEKRLG